MRRLLIGGAVVVACLTAAWLLAPNRKVTTSMPSPDGRWEAELLDTEWGILPAIDRNFHVRIVRCDGDAQTVFMSPDQSPSSVGNERFLWSSDSTRLLVVGRRFYVRKSVRLKNDESLYFMYDLPSGQVWCNYDEQCGHPTFGMADLSGYDFGEELLLAEDATAE